MTQLAHTRIPHVLLTLITRFSSYMRLCDLPGSVIYCVAGCEPCENAIDFLLGSVQLAEALTTVASAAERDSYATHIYKQAGITLDRMPQVICRSAARVLILTRISHVLLTAYLHTRAANLQKPAEARAMSRRSTRKDRVGCLPLLKKLRIMTGSKRKGTLVEHGYVQIVWKREFPFKSDAQVWEEEVGKKKKGLSEEAYPLLSMSAPMSSNKKVRRGKRSGNKRKR